MYRKNKGKSFNLRKALLNKRFRLAISEKIQHKMADAAAAATVKQPLMKTLSDNHAPAAVDIKNKLHRKSWDASATTTATSLTNSAAGAVVVVVNKEHVLPVSPRERAPVSPRGPMKSLASHQKQDDVGSIPEENNAEDADTTPKTSPRSTKSSHKPPEPPREPPEDCPDPDTQREVITSIDTECTCVYAVSKIWYRKWEEYVGAVKGHTAGESERPGTIDMDTQNDGNNEYLHEDKWKKLTHWYGIARSHQYDRKHVFFKDEKMFDVCMLSPFSGIVEHQVKKFNRFEEIGYIECQLRRIFHVDDHKKSRLWISEKAQVPRFRLLLSRCRMLNDSIRGDKVYILALEECTGFNMWPTGEPGVPKGELSRYNDVLACAQPETLWADQVNGVLDSLTEAVVEAVQVTTRTFLQQGQTIIEDKETDLEQSRKSYETKLETTKAKENFLTEKSRELSAQEERLTSDRETLEKDIKAFQKKEDKFNKEMEQIQAMHKIKQKKIKLDIGGTIFTTAISTLQRDPNSLLAAMFSGKHELELEEDNSYFIDRDGTFFRFVLNFLRDGYLDQGTMPCDHNILREILREAKHYQVAELVAYLEEQLQRSPSAQSTGSAKSFSS